MLPVWALLWFAALPARADVYIGVSGAGGQLPLVGAPPLLALRPDSEDDAALAAKLGDVVRSDLLWSRWFRVSTQGPDPAQGLGPALDGWKSQGAAAMVWGHASTAGGKSFLEGRIYDPSSGSVLWDRNYQTTAANWRALAHTFSDDIVRQLTGKSGIARTRIAFIGDKGAGKELYVMDYDGGDLVRLTHDDSIDLLPRWNRDGTKIAYTTYRYGNPDIYELTLGDGRPRALVNRQGLNMPGGYSPDGTSFLYTGSYAGGATNLYLLDLKTRRSRQISFHTGVDSSGSFSPDGLDIAFVSDRSGNPQVHVMELDTGRTELLTDLNWCDTPQWQPGGAWIAFSGRPGVLDALDIYLVDPTGTNLKQLTRSEGSNEDPSWSPDGRFIAFTSTRSGRSRLYVMDADGSAPHAVGDFPGNVYTPSWGPEPQ